MRLIRVADLPVSRWANGAGRKSDIAAGDGWMVGYAWLDGDAPFSNLAGFDRTITLLEGPGFTLDISGRAPLVLDRMFVPASFDGGAPTTCRVAGPCRVLNVMTARDRFRHSVEVADAVTQEETDFVVVLRGAAMAGGAMLAQLDTIQRPQMGVVGKHTDSRLARIVIQPLEPHDPITHGRAGRG